MLTIDGLAAGDWLQSKLDQLALLSDTPRAEGVTRLPFTARHADALALLSGWMQAAGLAVHRDAAATLVGRREGPAGAPTLLLGSHQDSIRNGGRYDGILGVLLPIAVLHALRERVLPFAIEVLAFADEEGVRFPTALMGPRCLAGTFDPGDLALKDRDGIALGDALAGFGGDPGALTALARDSDAIRGYLEVHIEQGPVLEHENLPLGVVTGICGIERWEVIVTGRAAHAGTTPMDLRSDALCAAAEIVNRVEAICRERDGVVGVVGRLDVSPNVVNAIPGCVALSMELRAAEDALRQAAAEAIGLAIDGIAATRPVTIERQRTYAQPGVHCDATLMQALADGIASAGFQPHHLMSGATHDASAMADLCPVAMLFVRCAGGISHHPDESVDLNDLQAAADALAATLLSIRSASSPRA